jgi:uncharacterized protein (DUF433 family)
MRPRRMPSRMATADAAISLGRGVYSARLAAHIAHVSPRQLRYWVDKGLLKPSAFNAPYRHRDLFTYTDLVQARVIGRLRQKGLSLQRITKAIAWLRVQMQSDTAWHTKSLVTDGQDLFVLMDGSSTYSAVRRPGQKVFTIFLGDVAEELENAGRRLGLGTRIETNPEIQGGTPVLRNTRIPTRLIAELVRDGYSPAEITRMYPGISPTAVKAADQFERKLASA